MVSREDERTNQSYSERNVTGFVCIAHSMEDILYKHSNKHNNDGDNRNSNKATLSYPVASTIRRRFMQAGKKVFALYLGETYLIPVNVFRKMSHSLFT